MVQLPREHGFWAILLSVLGCSLLRTGPTAATLAAAVIVLVAAALAGGATNARVRRSGPLQVASSGLLGLSGVPLELLAHTPRSEIAVLVLSWTAVLCASSLCVRGVFARAARRPRVSAPACFGAAIALSAGVGLALALLWGGAPHAALACGLTAAVCTAVWLMKPSVKQLKPIGIALAGLTASCAVALAF